MMYVVSLTGSNKKVSVTEFKGKILVHIRVFYDDKITGEEKPGHTGICLSVEQWGKLKETVNKIKLLLYNINHVSSIIVVFFRSIKLTRKLHLKLLVNDEKRNTYLLVVAAEDGGALLKKLNMVIDSIAKIVFVFVQFHNWRCLLFYL